MHDDGDQRSGAHIDGDMTKLQREVGGLRAALAERDDALRTLRERFEHDLLQARRELAQARTEQESLSEQLHASKSSSSTSAPTAPVARNKKGQRRPWRRWRPRPERPMEREMALMYQSGLFAADWYLAEYPDVANTGIDPAEHYLLHGAAEGRNPGPEFNTHQYLFEHPALVDSGENPLLHFIRSGGTVT